MIGFEKIEAVPLPGPKQEMCPSCKHPLALITHAQALQVACPKCQKLLEMQHEALVQIADLKKKYSKVDPVIPVGTQGRIKGVLYAVVGFLVYKEKNFKYRWREYVLFNPLHGYAFLAEYDGHWNLFQYISDYTNHLSNVNAACHYLDREFKLYHKYRSEVFYAQGEFFWKINADNSQYIEYISPPYMLARSVNRDEQTWMLGEYMEPEEIQLAFPGAAELPAKMDVGSTEPFSKDFGINWVGKMSGLAAGLLLVLQLLFAFFNKEKVVLHEEYPLPADHGLATLPPVPSSVVEVNSALAGTSSLEMILRAPVENTWFAAAVSLINTKTGKEYYIELGVEFYKGYEDGTHWTEGSTSTSEILSSIPDGTYRVLIQPYRENSSGYNVVAPDRFTLLVKNDVPIWSNFWVCIALLLAVPLVQGWRAYSFEKSRWMNSDFSPYNQE
ncbi:MAG: DUF4178 domain-containing protein [Rufibacter sp.]